MHYDPFESANLSSATPCSQIANGNASQVLWTVRNGQDRLSTFTVVDTSICKQSFTPNAPLLPVLKGGWGSNTPENEPIWVCFGMKGYMGLKWMGSVTIHSGRCWVHFKVWWFHLFLIPFDKLAITLSDVAESNLTISLVTRRMIRNHSTQNDLEQTAWDNSYLTHREKKENYNLSHSFKYE